MRDLADIYIEARFGKEAADEAATPDAAASGLSGIKAYLTMPQLTEKTLAIRNAIEESVRQEKRLKARAKALAAHARYRVFEAPKAGLTGQISDIIRAAIPGLSPAASTDGIEKPGGLISYTTPKAEKKYDIAHILAAGGGAGLGAASQRGMLSTAGGQRALGDLISSAQGTLLGTPGKQRELGKLIASVMGGAKPTMTSPPLDASLAKLFTAAHDLKPGPAKKALEKLIEAVRASKSTITGPAKVMPEIAQAGTIRGMLGTLKSVLKLKGVPAAAAKRRALLSQLGGVGKKVRLGGGKGALLGAAAVSLPFAIRRWWINRQMRAQGGRAAAEAATTAEANIIAAKKLQKWRKQQLAQLEEAVGPGAATWTPPAAPAAPGPAPAPTPVPGPFGRYELTPFQQ